MHSPHLGHDELLELDPDGGTLRFAGQRALLLDAVAIGIFRKYLFENFGPLAAQAALTQFGFAHGWRMAEATANASRWDGEDDWQSAGSAIHRMQGLLLTVPGSQSPLSTEGAELQASFEAEQHLIHFGVSETPICWTICGMVSGYLSRSSGKEIYVLEDRCLGRGDSGCHLVARTALQWGEAHSEDLKVFDQKRLVERLELSRQQIAPTVTFGNDGKVRQPLAPSVPEVDAARGIVTKSAEMHRIIDFTRRIAKVDATVVITGESGCGKERVARLLHDESPRAAGPFIAVNCAAITESLLESELFGHARGSFSGATHERAGLFEAAEGGTLLLDEVGELPLGMQTKLLRVLQEREVRRVGENKSRAVDVRIIASTNVDLERAVHEQVFRQDLFYRLNVVAIRVPPLRHRREDILPLAHLMIRSSSDRMRQPPKDIAGEAAARLLEYAWPGNVRELENAMERAVALSESELIELCDLPPEVRLLSMPQRPRTWQRRPLHEVEREHILASLHSNGGNQARTATDLEIGSATLYRKLKSYKAKAGEQPDRDPQR